MTEKIVENGYLYKEFSYHTRLLSLFLNYQHNVSQICINQPKITEHGQRVSVPIPI